MSNTSQYYLDVYLMCNFPITIEIEQFSSDAYWSFGFPFLWNACLHHLLSLKLCYLNFLACRTFKYIQDANSWVIFIAKFFFNLCPVCNCVLSVFCCTNVPHSNEVKFINHFLELGGLGSCLRNPSPSNSRL